MGKPETNLWTWLRGARKTMGPLLRIRRVENLVSTGDTDVDGVYDSAPFFIELKAGARPKRPTTPVRHEPVKDEQVEFANEVLAAGAFHAFLVAVGSGVERRVYVIPGRLGRWLQTFRAEYELAQHGYEVYTPSHVIETVLKLKELTSNEY